MTFYRAVELPSDEPVQYVGVYVLKWGKVDQPTVGFVEDETVPDLLAALEAIVEAVDDEWQGPPFSEPMLTDRDHALLEQANAAIKQARAALAGARGGEGAA